MKSIKTFLKMWPETNKIIKTEILLLISLWNIALWFLKFKVSINHLTDWTKKVSPEFAKSCT